MSKTIQEIAAEERKKAAIRTTLWSVVAVLVIIASIVAIKMAANDSKSGTADNGDSSPATAELMAKVSSVPASVFTTVGLGNIQSLPRAITAPALTQNDKPYIAYIGAEYCPFCAAERWPMVVALSRFGSFTGLRVSHSSTTDVFPNTQTFSFHGSTYTSQYISFEGVETLSNQPQGTSYAPLDTPTAQQNELVNTYDAAPYVSANSAGAIPFIDFGGKFVLSGASFDPSLLQGKTTSEIATALNDPTTDISKAIIGSANTITAAICTLTFNQPSEVCTNSAIQALQATINANK